MSKSNGTGGLATAAQGMAMPSWMTAMREAAQSVVKPDDIKAIVQKQLELAKQGDRNAMRFIFDQVLGGASFKGATFVQNNFASPDALPDKPTTGRPGSPRKVEAMRQRVAAGMPAMREDDGPGDDE